MKGQQALALGPRKPASHDDKQDKKQDPQQDVFMREVDDAVRKDRLMSFWERYGVATILGIVAGIALLGGWLYWQSREQAAAGVTSEEFVGVLDALGGNDIAAANAGLARLTTADQPGYRAAAMMMQGNVALEQGDTAAAVAAYARVAADDDLPQPYRDAALIRQTAAEFDTLASATTIERLEQLATPGNAWFGSAGEMVALSHMRMNKPELAGPLFAQMAKDESVPGTIRARARQMAGVLGIDTIEDAEAVASGAEARGE